MLSDPAMLISGVIQRSVLGPLMFLVFINELAEVLAKFGIVVKLFADDVKLYVKIMNDVDVRVLQHAIDALCRWAEEWQLTVSIDIVPTVEVFIDGTRLPLVTSCRDLGVTISVDLTPSVHVNNIVIKGHQCAIVVLCHVTLIY